MKRILSIIALVTCLNVNSQSITDVEINNGAAYLRQTNGKIFAILKPVTAINIEFIYLTDTSVTLWGNKPSPERTFLLSQLVSFKVDGVAKAINSFVFKSEFAKILNTTVSTAGLSPGAATSVLQEEQIDTAAATNTILRQLIAKPVGSDSVFIKRTNDTLSSNNNLARLDAIKQDTANARLLRLESKAGVSDSIFIKTTNDTLSSRLTTSIALPTNGVKALNVRQVQTTALVGVNIPTVTAYTTNTNTVVTTNVNEIVIENMSLTTTANFTYGGQTFILGHKGNGITPSFYNIKVPYDASSFKYSPFATLIVNAASSSVFVTKYFIQ